ncbi:MAG: hypothetical protein SOZ87_02525 [Candidatus Cryptobacteroides sp.]|nr:hypothetical protein [Candidatus Cryptobacteroides sp.]
MYIPFFRPPSVRCRSMSHWSSGVCPRLALVADGLAGGGVDAGDVAGISSDINAGAACESVSDQGRGTKWSVAGEAVW